MQTAGLRGLLGLPGLSACRTMLTARLRGLLHYADYQNTSLQDYMDHQNMRSTGLHGLPDYVDYRPMWSTGLPRLPNCADYWTTWTTGLPGLQAYADYRPTGLCGLLDYPDYQTMRTIMHD